MLILVLNLFLCGVGSLILGQKPKGIAYIVAGVAVAYWTCGTGTLAICIFAAIDGYLQARQLETGHRVAQWTFFNDHR